MHVRRLAPDIFFPHIDVARQAKESGRGRRSDTVLSCASFRDDALFAEALGQENLAESIIDLMGAGMAEVFAFQINSAPAERFAQTLGVHQRRGTPDECL